MLRILATVAWICCLGIYAQSTVAEKPRAPLNCRAVGNLEVLLAPGAVLLLGELHGTVEAPAFTANAACLALKAGRRILVGLEIPHQENERVERFLDSGGSAADRQALLMSPFWQDPYQDGRRSRAMADLLDELRGFRQGGHSVRVTLFDSDEADGMDHRDQAMAARLKQVIGDDDNDVALILTGNLHSRLVQGRPRYPEFEPMGLFIARGLEKRRPLALKLSSTGGTAWTCISANAEECGAHPMGGRGEGENWHVVVDDDATPGKNGHHGRFHVGAISASPPAAKD